MRGRSCPAGNSESALYVTSLAVYNTLSIGISANACQVLPALAPETAAALQGATRLLAGVALRSLDVLDGAVTRPQFRMLAGLASLGRARPVQAAQGLGWRPRRRPGSLTG